jgi:CheY-like chemotaxis protein
MSTERLRILIVEDKPSDAELARIELRRSGLAFDSEVVETREQLVDALARLQPDVVLSDYTLPALDGMEVVGLARLRSPGTPVVIVTGSIDEETAVACMRAGAADYIIKDRIGRLGSAVQSALDRARAAREKAEAVAALREAEARERRRAADLEVILDAIPIPVWICREREAAVMTGNPAADRLLRIPRNANASKTAPADQRTGTFRIESRGREIEPSQLPLQRRRAAKSCPARRSTSSTRTARATSC